MHIDARSNPSEAAFWRAYLDGRLVPFAIAADDEEGYIEVLDDQWINSNLGMSDGSDPGDEHPEPIDEIRTRKIYGRVRLERIQINSIEIAEE